MPAAAVPRRLPAGNCGVTFEKVNFSYGGRGAAVLADISVAVEAGETIGIIGSTGAGKTTLMYLLMRFYDACGGCVRVAGIDVRDLDVKELRDRIAIVPQKATLFSGTAMDNICWGRPEAGEDEVVRAATIAQAHGFIASFPEGYCTVLGQGGVNLSGGQKQRISIARALVRNPTILILDDCTSTVDLTTEAAIRQGLATYMAGLTAFIVTQRITSVMLADRVLVLDNGRIAGLGTHAALMDGCAVYRDIYRSQIGEDDGGGYAG